MSQKLYDYNRKIEKFREEWHIVNNKINALLESADGEENIPLLNDLIDERRIIVAQGKALLFAKEKYLKTNPDSQEGKK